MTSHDSSSDRGPARTHSPRIARPHFRARERAPGMTFISTRGGVPSTSFIDAVLTGVPLDGGAYVPERVPRATRESAWREDDFAKVAGDVFWQYIERDSESGFTKQEVMEVIRTACANAKDVAQCVRMKGKSKSAWRCELARGGTLSAEDCASAIALGFIEKALKRGDKRANVICAATGEDGGALANAAAKMTRVDAWIAYPGDDGATSDAQEREMTTVVEDHVHAIKVMACPDGASDVAAVVSDLIRDDSFRAANGLVLVDACNVARMLSYVAVFFYAYSRVLTHEEYGEEVVFSVPSSGFGFEFAGHLARMMGLPVTVVCACNANGAAHRVVEMGELYKTDLVHTSSSALDIVVPENIWRSLYYAVGENPVVLSALQDEFDADGEVALPAKAVREFSAVFKSAVVNEETMLRTIKREESNGYLPCPQTAIAIAALDLVRGLPAGAPVVALVVSHPSKFPDVIRRAVPNAVDSPASKHPTIDAMSGLFHRRRTCSLEELERSLRRDIPAVARLRSPEPVRVERSLLTPSEFEAIARAKMNKRRRMIDFDNPVVSIAAAIIVAVWAAATTPRPTAADRAIARDRRAREKRLASHVKTQARRSKIDAKNAAREEKRRMREEKKTSRARVGAPSSVADDADAVRPFAYARLRRGPRLANPHFALDDAHHRTLSS